MTLLDKNKRRFFWALLLLALGAWAVGKYICVKESEAKKYYKAKESRRGSLRKAKEQKKAIQLHQEREGVTRQLFLENDAPSSNMPRREFFLEADSADIKLELQSKDYVTIECFERPRGWFQEEIYWILESTLERVIPLRINKGVSSDTLGDQVIWVYEADQSKKVEEEKTVEISPRQRVRYFDAGRAEWNFMTNVLTAYMVSFCIVDVPGHTPTRLIDPQSILMEAEAETSTFNFQAPSDQEVVVSTGMKLKLGSRNSSIGE